MTDSTTPNLDQNVRRLSENWAVDRSESAKWLAVGLAALALLFIWLGDGEASAVKRVPLFLAGLSVGLCAFGIWLLSKWSAGLALPLSGLALATLVSAGAYWLQIPGLLLLAGLPVVHLTLAGQGGVAAVLGLALSIALWADDGPFQPVDKVLVITGIAALWLISARARYSMTSRVTWAWQQYILAQQKLEEARDRNQQLDAVLDQQIHTNRQLDLLNERLAALRRRAEDSQRTKTAFVAKVSHEFRTPLNMIIGLVDLLVESPHVYGEKLPSRLVEDLKIVHRNCEYLSGMINDVLDLSQTEAGRLNLRREIGDLCIDIRHAAEIVRPLAEKKKLRLDLEIPKAPVYCLRDQTRLRQVLLNLLSNAARYTPGGIITVRLLQQPRNVRIEVSDTGLGIDTADLERIFEPFFQSGSMDGLAQTGTGLGLSISKQFIEMHGGELGVESQKGIGSTFWICLPILPPDDPVQKPERWIHAEWAWHERQNRVDLPHVPCQHRVILLDIGDGIHPLMDERLEHLELISTNTVAEVAQATTSTPAHGILINGPTAEAVLPVMAEICYRMPDTPVVGWAVPTPSSRAHAAGAIEYLVKPVTRGDLISVLAMVPKPVKRILLVDDDVEVQRLLARFLIAYDETIQVDTATDVDGALALMYASFPDLILLDLVLQQGTGWELLARKQEQQALAAIPAVILSAQDPMEHSLHSQILVASMGTGFTLPALQEVSLALIDMLLSGSGVPDQASE
jgi:signal transduction histidine kinase/CheY-like chemotaxis protein